MSQQYKSADEQEIDFSVIGSKLKGAALSIDAKIFRFFFFLRRNILIIALLFIAGGVLGYFLDKSSKSYKNEVIVIPNFGSADHIYSQIGLIQAKIEEHDTIFLKQIGVKEPKKLLKIKIEPINNVYEFVHQRPTNFELIKLMAEDGNINKVIEDEVTSKNYSNHRISFIARNVFDREAILEPLLTFLNSSNYYDTIKKQQSINLDTKMRVNDSIIKQIDGIVDEFKKAPASGARSSSLVYYNENTQLSDILKKKEELIDEQAMLKIAKINYTDVVKEVANSLNIRNKSGLTGINKFILPIIFILLFIAGAFVVKYIKSGLNRNRI